MAIPSRPIGQDPQSQLLWNISKQMEQLIAQVGAVVKNTAPSTTTTTTTIASFQYSLNNSSTSTNVEACNNFAGAFGYTTLYATTSNPSSVTVFYTDPGLTTIFNGNPGDYYAFALTSDIFNVYSAQIGSMGDVANINSCGF